MKNPLVLNAIKAYFIFLFITLYFLGLYSCKDKPHPQLFIDQKTKDYIVFQAGSWWSYEEKSTFFLDTISIYLNESSMNYWEDFASEEFEQISLYLKWSSGSAVSPGDRSRYIRISSDVNSKKNVGICEEQFPWFMSPNIVFIPFDTIGENHWGWQNDTIKYEMFYDSITIKGKTFYEVMEISNSSYVHYKKPKRIWWAKNIGRIKWENFGGEVWELTNYHVIQ